MNFLEGVIRREGPGVERTFRGINVAIDIPQQSEARDRVFLGVRPQHLEVFGGPGTGDDGTLRAEVGVVEPMGNEQIVYVTLSGGDRLVAVAPPDQRVTPGDIVSIRVRPEGLHVFDAATGARLK